MPGTPTAGSLSPISCCHCSDPALSLLQAKNAAPDLSQLPDPSELFGKAKGAANEASGKAKGAADQASGSLQGAAGQAKGSASGVADKVRLLSSARVSQRPAAQSHRWTTLVQATSMCNAAAAATG